MRQLQVSAAQGLAAQPLLVGALAAPKVRVRPTDLPRAGHHKAEKETHGGRDTDGSISIWSGAFDGGTEGRAGWGGGAVGSGSVSEGLGGRVGGWDGGRHKVEQRGGGGC